jgi:tetratricopeptide (TPR) repeat protein
MLRKTHQHSERGIALPVCASFIFFALAPSYGQAPQAAPAVVDAPVAAGTLNRLFTEAEAAFGTKEYNKAIDKIQELLKAIGNNKEAPLELLYFYLGLGNLLGEKSAEAEAAFTECLKRFPKGEYASRCYLGIGRACIVQGTPAKKEQAIQALKAAALDPKYRSEAGLSLGQVLMELDKQEEAMVVFKSLMGSDIRSPQQTTAAVEVIGLLANTGKLQDLVNYLDRLSNQSGVRDAIAWYANQVIVRGDELVGAQKYAAALAIYRTVPPRSQILEVQSSALESQRRQVSILEKRVELEKDKPINQRSAASDFLNNIKPAVELAEKAMAAIQEKADLDSAVLMRRGRCLYYLERYEEALICFRYIRNKYSDSSDALAAAYAEIVLLSKLQNIPEIKILCEAYLRKYPDSENAEQVGTLAGEVLVQGGNWEEVGAFYRNLATKFPKSQSLDRYTFFQGVALFQDAKIAEALPIFTKFLKDYPNSTFAENALYYVAMANFLTNNYKETLKSCKEYLSKFPDGNYAGDMRYRLSFIDFNDPVDQSDKIIKDLTAFLNTHPSDSSAGSMYCLLADTFKKKTSDKQDELAKFQKLALEAYKKAVWTESSDDVIQYALDSATALLQGNKDWSGIADLHNEFLKRRPNSSLALLSATQLAKMKTREGKGTEAAEMLGQAVKARLPDPTNEQVEFLIDEMVKALVPRGKKPAEIDVDAIDKQLVDMLTALIGDKENATTNARLYYARAQLARLVRRPDRAELYLKGIATINAKTPAVLSPALLAVSGDILLKLGNIDEAEAMFRRLIDRHKDGMFADAGPVGLGYIALARKQGDEAYRIFEEALTTGSGTSRMKEASLGKIEALIVSRKFDEALKLAQAMAGDKSFRGETAGKSLMLAAKIYREQASNASDNDAKTKLFEQAHGTYQKVYIAYQSTPEVCAEAYWQAYETLNLMGNKELADKTLETLKENPKLKNTERFKQASK